jgi:hypothetical protein
VTVVVSTDSVVLPGTVVVPWVDVVPSVTVVVSTDSVVLPGTTNKQTNKNNLTPYQI